MEQVERFLVKGEREQDVPGDGRNHPAEGFHHPVVKQVVVPRGFGACRNFPYSRHDEVVENQCDKIRHQ